MATSWPHTDPAAGLQRLKETCSQRCLTLSVGSSLFGHFCAVLKVVVRYNAVHSHLLVRSAPPEENL
jgi:hypothetical protein